MIGIQVYNVVLDKTDESHTKPLTVHIIYRIMSHRIMVLSVQKYPLCTIEVLSIRYKSFLNKSK